MGPSTLTRHARISAGAAHTRQPRLEQLLNNAADLQIELADLADEIAMRVRRLTVVSELLKETRAEVAELRTRRELTQNTEEHGKDVPYV